jgi:hypothetical protein
MFGPSFNDYYRTVLDKVKQDILNESEAQILGSNIDELGTFYFGKYALQVLEFDEASVECDFTKQVRRVPAHQRESFYRNEGDIDWEYESAVILLPIQPNPNLDWIKKLQGASRTLDGFDDRISYSTNEISYTFDTKWYGGSMNEDAIAQEINTKSKRLIDTLTQKNNNIAHENFQFLSAIKEAITQRKTKLEADKAKVSSLTQKIQIPIRQKIMGVPKKITTNVREFVRVVKPEPRLPEEYRLEESLLGDILMYVDSQCQTFERTPASYQKLGEEELRDIVLSALNGIFEGNATGETFVKKGKTDIHLKIDKGEILIFECKNWGGEKIYLDTIDQLIGYVTWRQNYGVIIMFCKNKDFSKILAQVPGIIQKHSLYVSGCKQISASHFVSEHSLPEDSGKVIKIHHLIYNLYSE